MALDADSIVSAIDNQCGFKRLIIAYSGGLDSSALLHLCVQNLKYLASQDIALSAVYIDHQLQAQSTEWAAFCRQQCQQYGIEFDVRVVNAMPRNRQSPEDAAREARYQAFESIISTGDCLLTAHHLSDQAETLLLQMLRGAGPKGLAAMPVLKSFANGHLLRPLLSYSRDEIHDYACHHQFPWIEDSSNQDRRYKRNFIRHEIMPALASQWPAMEKTLFRVTQLQAESIEILQSVAEQDLQACCNNNPTQKLLAYLHPEQLIGLSQLQGLSTARINNLIQYWLRSLEVPVLSSTLLERLRQELIFSSPQAQPEIKWHGNRYALRRFRGYLVLSKEQVFDSSLCLHWTIDGPTELNYAIGKIKFITDASLVDQHYSVNNLSVIDRRMMGDGIEIRFRQGGEKFRIGDNSHHSLKKWLQENHVPFWLRDQIPLFYIDSQLVQVGNTLVDKRFASDEQDNGLVMLWFQKGFSKRFSKTDFKNGFQKRFSKPVAKSVLNEES